VALSAGFGCGPLVSGLLAQFFGSAAYAPFVVTVALSAAAVLVGIVFSDVRTDSERAGPVPAAAGPAADDGDTFAALSSALPMALWVFSCATVAMVTMAERMQARFAGPWIPGVAATVALVAGVTVQMVARRRGWGPPAGVAGAAIAATGFGLVAAAGATPALPVFLLTAAVLGIAYGLCLREGLIDVETLAPPRLRGTLTGVFYSVTYVGFGVPLLLVAIRPAVGITAPVLVLTALAAAAAVLRAIQIRARPRMPATGSTLAIDRVVVDRA
jgi:hypothetical protein